MRTLIRCCGGLLETIAVLLFYSVLVVPTQLLALGFLSWEIEFVGGSSILSCGWLDKECRVKIDKLKRSTT